MQVLFSQFIKGIEIAYFDKPDNISLYPGVITLFEQLRKVILSLSLFLSLSLCVGINCYL